MDHILAPLIYRQPPQVTVYMDDIGSFARDKDDAVGLNRQIVQWINSSKEDVLKKRLNWKWPSFGEVESERVWPMKSVMNPVWQKLSLGMVSNTMRSAAMQILVEEEKEALEAWHEHIEEYGTPGFERDTGSSFAERFENWIGRLVASLKRPLNFGDKENKHNKSLLHIQSRHAKIALAGRSVDQQEEDDLMTNVAYTLEDYGFTVTCG